MWPFRSISTEAKAEHAADRKVTQTSSICPSRTQPLDREEPLSDLSRARGRAAQLRRAGSTGMSERDAALDDYSKNGTVIS